MKLNILFLTFLFLSLSLGFVKSQKLDLDKEYWDLSSVNIPQSNELVDLKTYSVSVYGDPAGLPTIGLTADKIEAAVKLAGFTYTADAADIDIDVNIEPFRTLSETIESKDISVKDGANTVTKKVYYVSSKYIAPTTIKINANREIVNRTVAGSMEPIIIESGTYSTYEAASGYLKGNHDSKMAVFKNKYLTLFNEVFNNFKNQYDYAVKKESVLFWNIDLRKHRSLQSSMIS